MSNRSQTKNQAITPIVIKQIHCYKKSQFYIYGTSVQIVCIVGVVRRVYAYSCEIDFILQDFSGTIKCKIRLETESESATKLAGIKENSYAQVFGFIRDETEEKYVLILKMFPIDDINLIPNHILQAISFVLKAKIERKRQLASASSTGTALANSLAISDEVHDSAMISVSQFTELQKLVYDIVKSECAEAGITRKNILRQFPSYQGIEVNQAVEYLINEGLIYYSIDQEHLKAVALY